MLRSPDINEPPPEVGPLDGDDIEHVAREITMRGAVVPAVLFLEANRGAGSLDGLGMLFFDPAIRRIFGGDDPGASHVLIDDNDIERLIDRLEELDAEFCLDA